MRTVYGLLKNWYTQVLASSCKCTAGSFSVLWHDISVLIGSSVV